MESQFPTAPCLCYQVQSTKASIENITNAPYLNRLRYNFSSCGHCKFSSFSRSNLKVPRNLSQNTKLNARLALRQRADLLVANISTNRISLPQGQSYTEGKYSNGSLNLSLKKKRKKMIG